MKNKVVLNKQELNKTIRRMASEIVEMYDDFSDVVIIGMQTRGVFLANRIVREICALDNYKIETGSIDASLYRDDVGDSLKHSELKETDFPVDINDKRIILVDDVLYTGRSVRAAIDFLMDFSRPKSIKLAVLIDRGNRELPIQPDFVGKRCVTRINEKISVELSEVDKKEQVLIV